MVLLWYEGGTRAEEHQMGVNGADSAAGAATLLERGRALAVGAAALESARAGDGAVLFVVAEAGLGKTTLLGELRARAAGFTVGWASCSEAEASLPFGLLDRLLGDLGAPGARVEEQRAGSAEARVGRYAGIVEWLRSAAPKPLLLAVDDLHQADPDSAELLALVCRRLRGLGVAVVATLRPWPPATLESARVLSDDGVATVEHLDPLSDAASAELLLRRLGVTVTDGLVERAQRACSGNPLLLGYVADAWRRGEDPLGSQAGTVGAQMFLPRFAGVGSSGLRWATAASVLGRRFRSDLVGIVAGQHPDEALDALASLCSAGLVRYMTAGEAEFVHPLFRQVLYSDIPGPVRQDLHARAFRLLRERGAEPAESARHALAAHPLGGPEAAEVLASAGRDALAVGALATAAEHLTAAVRVTGSATPPAVRLELAGAQLAIGRVGEAEQTVRRYLADPALSGRERVVGLRLLGQVLLASAGSERAKHCTEEASALAARFDPDLAAEVLLDSTFIGWLFEGPTAARATTQNVLQMLERFGSADTALRRAASTADANLALLSGDPCGLDEVAAAARAEVGGWGDGRVQSAWRWDVVFGYVNLAKLVERFDDDAAFYTAMAGAALEQGALLTYQSYAVNQADTLWRVGRLDEARALLVAALEVAQLAPTLAPFASVGMAHTCQEAGEYDESARWAERVEQIMGTIGESPYLRLWLSMLSCRGGLAAGRIDDAVAAGERAAEVAERSGIIEPCVVPWHGPAIEAHVAAGDLDRALELATWLEGVCAPLPCRAPRAVALAGRAAVAWRLGQTAQAEALYEEALRHNAAVPMPLAEAETLIAYARFLRRTGRVGRARAALHRALDLVEPVGAVRLARIAAEELAAAGGRRRNGSDSSELTSRERRVVALAAEGRTDTQIAAKLFLSPRTVGHHLSSAYAKLGVSSRRELMMRPVPRSSDGQPSST